MDKFQFQKRIVETETDIFPLDRLLPLDSVYTIFHIEYEKEDSKSAFLNNRVYSRLREGYYALFATLAYSINTGKHHHICFPSEPSNDFYMIELNRNKQNKAYCFDVKEYGRHSESFEGFLQESVFPRIDLDTYDLVIGLHVGVSASEQMKIYDHLKDKNSPRMVYLVAAATADNDDEDISRVTAITKQGVVQNLIVNLKEHLSKQGAVVVYQDLIKFKETPDSTKPESSTTNQIKQGKQPIMYW